MPIMDKKLREACAAAYKEARTQAKSKRRGESIDIREVGMNSRRGSPGATHPAKQQPHWMSEAWLASAQNAAAVTQPTVGALRESFAAIFGDDAAADGLANAAARGREVPRLGSVAGEDPYAYYHRLGAMGSTFLHHPPAIREAGQAADPGESNPARLAEAFGELGLSPRVAAHAAKGR